MLSITATIILITVIVAYAASLPGTLLFLRGVSLLSDAISHAVLLGIAVMFLIVQSLNSVWLFIGATIAGVATVVATESLMQTQRIKHDAAIGIVFPCFFSIGILLISLYARNVHLDTDMVILGEVAFAPFYRLTIGGYDLGAHALWSGGIISIINTMFILLCFKELKATLFDDGFSSVVGLRPRLLYYVLMTLTSVTAVGAFEIVGSVVVVALMITPAATAYLLVHRFEQLLVASPVISICSAVGGYAMARALDVSIAGSIAAVAGMIFLGVLLGAPDTGLIARWFHKKRSRRQLAQRILQAYLRQQTDYAAKQHVIARDLEWSSSFVDTIITESVEDNTCTRFEDRVKLV